MIKKLTFVSFLLLLSPLCFAQQNLINDIEFFSGMPFINGIGESDNNEYINFSSKNPSFASGFGLVNYSLSNDDSVGVFFIYENYYTKAFIYNLTHDSIDEKIVFNRGNITTAENYQIGVKIQSLEAGNFKFPFMFGISTVYITASANPSPGVTWNIERTISGGIFASVAAELHFNESIFLFARLQTTFAFFTSTTGIKYTEATIINNKQTYYMDQYNELEVGVYTIINPVIGLGFKLNGLLGK